MSRYVLIIILIIISFTILGFSNKQPFSDSLLLLGKVIVVDPGHGCIG